MAAVAYNQIAIFRGESNGRVIHVPMTLTDVANAYATMPDGNTFLMIPSDQNYRLIDLIVIVGGTDMAFQDIYANGLATGLRINNKSNLNTANNRQFQFASVAFKAGSLLRLKESAT